MFVLKFVGISPPAAVRYSQLLYGCIFSEKYQLRGQGTTHALDKETGTRRRTPQGNQRTNFSVFAFRVGFVTEDLPVYLVLLCQAPTGFEPLLREASSHSTGAPVDVERGIPGFYYSWTHTEHMICIVKLSPRMYCKTHVLHEILTVF